MEYTLVKIDMRKIKDEDSFHDIFSQKMGFPSFYGRNMDAWIDCMTSIDRPEDGMTKVHAPKGGVLVLELENMSEMWKRCPDISRDIVDCASFVNYRRLEGGEESPVLVLSYEQNIHQTAAMDALMRAAEQRR